MGCGCGGARIRNPYTPVKQTNRFQTPNVVAPGLPPRTPSASPPILGEFLKKL